MGNITGNPFAPGVVKQINQRQTFMGADPKDDRHIIYQNNKGAFLRLASSIRIAGYDPTNIDEPNQQTADNSANEILQLRGLSSLYKKVYIIKPYTSRYANSEKYLVCKDFIYNDTSQLVNKLKDTNV